MSRLLLYATLLTPSRFYATTRMAGRKRYLSIADFSYYV
ncbi:hypothetical protein MY7_0957 [Bacillus sp. 5B6]|nr:hypothetical protein V529_10450 [Bacillus velezensis SQR9]EIF12634.1 hypothetical protein MY7_0957 [Bacillus sp. 5B6]